MADERAAGVVPLVEEQLTVGKRETAGGTVRVRTVTDVVEEIARVDLDRDEVEVTRVPVGRSVDAPPDVRVDGDVLIVPVIEEVAVVERRLVLKEELHVRRRRTREHAEIPVELRKQRAVVERSAEATDTNQDQDR